MSRGTIAPEWGSVKAAARYMGLGERTVRKLLKQGLPHTRLPTGSILIRFRRIDEFLEQFNPPNRASQIADDLLRTVIENEDQNHL